MSPVGHSALGLLGFQWGTKQKDRQSLFIFILIANLPDIDHLLLLVMGKPGLSLHQYFTHNIFFALLAAWLGWLFIVKKEKKRFFNPGTPYPGSHKREFLALIFVSYSHLILDLITIDHIAPIGFRLFYPLSDRFFNFGFFPNLLKGSLTEAFSLNNLLVIGLEAVVLMVPIAWIARRSLVNLVSKSSLR